MRMLEYITITSHLFLTTTPTFSTLGHTSLQSMAGTSAATYGESWDPLAQQSWTRENYTAESVVRTKKWA